MGIFFIGAGHIAKGCCQAWVTRWWPLLLVVGITLVTTGMSKPLDMKAGDWGTPVVSLVVAVLLSAGLLGLFELAFRRGGPAWISTAASLGLILVLTHGVPIYLIDYRWPWWATVASSLGFASIVAYAVRNKPVLGGVRLAEAEGSTSLAKPSAST